MGPPDNPAFGQPIVTAFFDPDWAFGWGQKASNWEYALSVEHQVVENVSVDVGYFRRHYTNFDQWDNQNVGPEDFTPYTITVPQDDRLPNGGGYQLTLLDMNPDAFARLPHDVKTSTNNLGDETEVWHGIDVSVSARLDEVLLQGGLALGQRTTDFCGLQEAVPEATFSNNTNASRVEGTAGSRGNMLASDFCRVEQDWLTNASLFGSYTFPYDIELSGSFFVRPGILREAIYVVPGADVQAALGRPSTLGTVSLNVIPPGSEFGDTLHQLDLRFAKILDFGGSQLPGELRHLQRVQRQRRIARAVRPQYLAVADRPAAGPAREGVVPVQLLALVSQVRAGADSPRPNRISLPPHRSSSRLSACAVRGAVRYSGSAAPSRRIQQPVVKVPRRTETGQAPG